MNRRLLRTTYHAEVEEVNFTHGLPAWMMQTLTGSSRAETCDYTDAYGSHYTMIARGNTGDGVTLSGSSLSMSVVKVVELVAVGVTVNGPAEFSLGFVSPDDGPAGIQLQAAPIEAGVAPAGRVRLLLRDGSSEGKQTLFAEGSDGQIGDGGTVIEDVDLTGAHGDLFSARQTIAGPRRTRSGRDAYEENLAAARENPGRVLTPRAP